MLELDGQTIKGVIYDLDGTLASSSLNFKAMREQVGCPISHDMLNFIEAMSDSQKRQQALTMIYDNEWQDAQTAHALPGAHALIAYCKERHIPQAIVTRNNKDAAKHKIEHCKLDIDTFISREHFPAKPDPSALLHIAQQWQIAPQYMIYVGDFKYDIEAAHHAKMKSVLVNAKQPNDYGNKADWQFATIAAFYQCLATSHVI